MECERREQYRRMCGGGCIEQCSIFMEVHEYYVFKASYSTVPTYTHDTVDRLNCSDFTNRVPTYLAVITRCGIQPGRLCLRSVCGPSTTKGQRRWSRLYGSLVQPHCDVKWQNMMVFQTVVVQIFQDNMRIRSQ